MLEGILLGVWFLFLLAVSAICIAQGKAAKDGNWELKPRHWHPDEHEGRN